MAHQLDTVFVWVSDLDRSVEWYRLLGIESGARYGAWQEMVLDGSAKFALHQGSRGDGRSTAVLSFRVVDLEGEIARLADLGITPSDEMITDTGAARFITFEDLDGNEIQLLER